MYLPIPTNSNDVPTQLTIPCLPVLVNTSHTYLLSFRLVKLISDVSKELPIIIQKVCSHIRCVLYHLQSAQGRCQDNAGMYVCHNDSSWCNTTCMKHMLDAIYIGPGLYRSCCMKLLETCVNKCVQVHGHV